MICIFGGTKGGTGKSTLTQNVAAWLASVSRDVLVVDADCPQNSVDSWATRREERGQEPRIQVVRQSGNLLGHLQTLSTKFDDVLVDVGGFDSVELRSAMVVADRLVVPIGAALKDLETVQQLPALVEQAHVSNPALRVHTVLTMVRPQHRNTRADEAADYLAELGFPPLRARFHRREAWGDSDAAGLAITEFVIPNKKHGDDKAIAELHALLQEIYGVEISEAAA